MDKPTLKISIAGNNRNIDIYESQPGKIVFEMDSTDPENDPCYGKVETDAKSFMELLQKLISR